MQKTGTTDQPPSNRKPHNTVQGYVCELKCGLGGYVVIYDRKRASWIDGDARWVVLHEPSSGHVTVKTLTTARAIMKHVARASTVDEARLAADILPRPSDG
jgi:hypothetical protein